MIVIHQNSREVLQWASETTRAEAEAGNDDTRPAIQV